MQQVIETRVEPSRHTRRRSGAFILSIVFTVVFAVSGCNGVEPPVASVPVTPTSSPTPTSSVSPSPSVSPTTVVCPNGVILPAGVSPAVCDGVPANASDISVISGIPFDIYAYAFVTPWGDNRCNWTRYDEGPEGGWSGGVGCEVTEVDDTSSTPQDQDGDDWAGYLVWVMSKAEKEENSIRIPWNYDEEGFPPILEYGTVIADYKWACSSEVDGLTCWNTETFHGFKLSETEQLVW